MQELTFVPTSTKYRTLSIPELIDFYFCKHRNNTEYICYVNIKAYLPF